MVQLKDAAGTIVPEAGVAVTASIESGGGSLGGTVTVSTNASGTAAFTGLAVSGLIGNRTLKFTATLSGTAVSVTSGPIALAAGAASGLTITTQPGPNAQSAVALAPQPAVQLTDAAGNYASQAGVVVTVSVATGTAALQGTTTATTDASGVAAFTNLALSGQTGAVTLGFAATVGGQARNVRSGAIALAASAALVLATPPTPDVRNGIPFLEQPVIQLSNGAGVPVAQAGIAVTASVSGAPAGILQGTPTVTTNASGRAQFTDLGFTGSGPYTLQFSAPGYAPVLSGSITVSAVTVSVLINGEFFGPLTKPVGHTLYFSFLVPNGTNVLQFSLSGGLGNADLYVRRGAYPTTTRFDCASTASNTTENCAISSNFSGQWYGVVHGATAYQAALLSAVAYDPSCAQQTLTLGVTVNGTLNNASDCKVPTLRDRFRYVAATPQVVQLTVTTNNFVNLRMRNSQTPRPGISSIFGAPGASGYVTLLGADTYNLNMVDWAGGLGGQSYRLTLAAASPNLATCAGLLALGGANASLTLANTDCSGITPGTRSGRVHLVIASGQTATITMASAAFDPFLRLLPGLALGSATVLSFDDNGGGGTMARIVYTNTGPDNNYTIEATSAGAGATGAYTLTINLSPTYPVTAPPGVAPRP